MKRLLILLVLPVLFACTATGTPLPPTPTSDPNLPTFASPTAVPNTSIPTEIPETDTPPPPVDVSVFPNPDNYTWQLITSGLDRPVDLQQADTSGRLFVVEKPGHIHIIENGQLIDGPFLNIEDRVNDNSNEMGLLGLAFHPNYAQNGYFYVNYTDLNGDTVIARFQVSADPDRADPHSELALLEVGQPYENHNGGALAFGPDGYLYIALGDGGSGGDPLGNGQSLTTLLGKLLRIDVDGGEPYAIPASNPFAAGGGLLEIWAYGLRNPWRFTFDPLTGDLYIGDVGQGDWEEIDFLPAGSPGGVNFGWNAYEGTHAYGGVLTEGGELVFPVAEYGHDVGNSVTGGVVYRGTLLSEWYGVYVYGDFGRGQVWGLVRQPDGAWQNGLLFETGSLISSFGQDASGEVYLVDYGGFLLRLESR